MKSASRFRMWAALPLLVAVAAIGLMVIWRRPWGHPTDKQPTVGEPAPADRHASSAPFRPSSDRPLETVRLRVEVLDAGGGPIPGAVVSVTDRALGRTNAAGRLEVTNMDGLDPSGSLVVRADGYVEQTKAYVVPAELTVQMLADSTVSGVVLRADTRAPLTDMLVGVGAASGISLHDGLFTVRGVAPGEHLVTARSGRWFGRSDGPVVVGPGGVVVGLRILAAAAYRIDGTVTAGARPIEGGTVSASGATTSIQAGGRFALEGMPPGRHAVRVRGGASSFAGAAQVTSVDVHDRDVTVHIDIGERYRVPVLVVDRQGAPVPGTSVGGTAAFGHVETSLRCVTGATGTCAFEDVPRGRLTEVGPGLGAPAVSVDIPRPQPGPLRFVVPTRGRMEGSVRTADGKAIVRPRAVALMAVDDSVGRPIRLTDETGRFVFDRLPPGGYDLEVRFPHAMKTTGAMALDGTEQPELTERVWVTSGQTTVVDLLLPPEDAALAGRVVDRNGQDVTRALVTVDASRTEACPAAGEPALASTLTDERGRFAVADLPRGRRYRLVARKETGECAVRLVRSGDTAVVVTVEPLGDLKVKLTGRWPAAATFAHVAVLRGKLRLDSGTIDSRTGSCTFDRLPAVPLTVEATAGEASAAAEVTLDAGRSKTVELTLR
jgi:hypothetical protein